MIYKKLYNGEIHTWFPKTIFLLDNFHKNNLKLYKKILYDFKDKTHRTEFQNIQTSHSKQSLHQNDKFKFLFKDILNYSLLFLNEIGYTKDVTSNFKITNSWFNIGKKGDFLHKHIHPGSILSGAFYINCIKKDKISFHKVEDVLLLPKTFNDLSFEYVQYQCIPGRLLLFPSNIPHSTNSQIGKEKITISFNIG
jgi:uncharacterized protein (TIGR02466 family)